MTLREVKPGERPSAQQHNLLVRSALRGQAGPGMVVDSTGSYQRPLPGAAATAGPVRFLAVITGSSLLAGHQARWLYTFAEVQLSAAMGPGPGGQLLVAYETVAGGFSGQAYNLAELAHASEPTATTPWYVWGVQAHWRVTGSSYPEGFRPRPVGGGGTSGGHQRDTVVEITRRTISGAKTYTFWAMGSHDGTCE